MKHVLLRLPPFFFPVRNCLENYFLGRCCHEIKTIEKQISDIEQKKKEFFSTYHRMMHTEDSDSDPESIEFCHKKVEELSKSLNALICKKNSLTQKCVDKWGIIPELYRE